MVIIRIFLNLFGMLSRSLILPIFLLRRHAFALILLAGIVYVVLQFTADEAPENYTASSGGAVTGAAPLSSGIVNPVTTLEDGNSMFAKDLLKAMDQNQATYYSRVFYAVLDQVEDGVAYPWQQGDIAGTLTPTETFKNGRGVKCRKFDEILKVGVTQQTINGQACERGDGSWCKLKLSGTAACGLHTKPGAFDGLKSLF